MITRVWLAKQRAKARPGCNRKWLWRNKNCRLTKRKDRKKPGDPSFFAASFLQFCYAKPVTVEMFSEQVAQALRAYDLYVICIDKTPDEFRETLISLLKKAIKAYESRGPNLRHGIALDRYVTVILSQSEGPDPLCGIYFNLHSPYQRQVSARQVPIPETTSGLEGA